MNTLKITNQNQITTITLNRPDVRNAFNDTLILELTDAFKAAFADRGTRAIILNGEGKVFSAGGDLEWMKKSATYTPEKNAEDALKLAELLETMLSGSKPIITLVHGMAMGGALGLISASDIVLSTADCLFSFSEVKLGLIPAVIGPFVIDKIGESQARKLFITGERFTAENAKAINLIHDVAANAEELISKAQGITKEILQNSPNALKEVKTYFCTLPNKTWPDKMKYVASMLAKLRSSDEGQEGMKAFFEKRKPKWAD
ncbi:enoyl-CoA hydratase/isomerase family protein [bacterium]|nr:enoyl-CoA hydratase/isomerase family protein [bacterium]